MNYIVRVGCEQKREKMKRALFCIIEFKIVLHNYITLMKPVPITFLLSNIIQSVVLLYQFICTST